MIDLPGFGFTRGEFSTHLLGKKFEVIQTVDVNAGDVLIDFNCINNCHQIPTKITSVRRVSDEFYVIKWGNKSDEKRQYAHNCLFGRLV